MVVGLRYVSTVKERFSREETESEVSRKLSVAVEIWLEPQYGLTVASSPQTAFLDGLKYQEIPAKVSKGCMLQWYAVKEVRIAKALDRNGSVTIMLFQIFLFETFKLFWKEKTVVNDE